MIHYCNYPDHCPLAHVDGEGLKHCNNVHCAKLREGWGHHFDRRWEVWHDGVLAYWSYSRTSAELTYRRYLDDQDGGQRARGIVPAGIWG